MGRDWKKCGIKNLKQIAIGNVKGAVDQHDGFFIPFANYKGSQGAVNGIIDTMGKRVDRRLDPNKFGRQWHVDRSKSQGLGIVFRPTNALIQAWKAKLKEQAEDKARRDAERRDRGEELYSIRELSEESNLNNSYNKVLDHKREQRKFIEEELRKAESKFRSEGGVKEEKEVKRLTNLLEDLENDIKALNNKEEEILHKVIQNDINSIKEALESDDIEDIGAIKNTIDFYKGNFPIFNSNQEIEIELGRLFKEGKNDKGEYTPSNYTKALRNKVERVLENDPNILETLNYLNTSQEEEVLGLRQELLRKEIIEDINDEITIKDLFYRNSDIDSVVMNFTTITDTFDNIIPQMVMNMFNNQQNQELNHVINMVDRIEKLKAENPDIKTDDFFDEDKRLVNLYTSKYSEALEDRYNTIEKFWKATYTQDKLDKYKDIIYWHKINTDVIDITKINDVFTVFGNKYGEYFEASEQEMQDYEQSIIDRIGVLEWNKMKQKILKQLHRYDEMREEFTDPNDVKNYTKVVRNNIWEFTKNYFGKGAKEFGYIRENGVKQFFTGFYNGDSSIGIQYIPKDIEKKGFYSQDFKEIANDNKKYQIWQAYREALTYISQSYYGDTFQNFYAPKISKDLGEKVTEALTDFKNSPLQSSGQLRKSLWKEWRELYYSKLPDNQKEPGKKVVSNNLDTSNIDFKNQVRALKQFYPKRTDEELEKMAAKQLAPTYSTDIDKSIKANLISASLHQARLRTEPKADAFLQTYKNIRTGKDGENGKVRNRAITKFEHYIDKVIYNNANELTKEDGAGVPIGKWIYKTGKALDNTMLSDKVKFIRDISKNMKNGAKLFTPQEAILIKTIEDYVNQDKDKNDKVDFIDLVFDDKYDMGEVQDIINNSGIDLNVASIVEGMLRASIIRHLGLNPASAITNRTEGKITNTIEDLRGEYWTTGNIHVAHDMLAYSNIADATQAVNRGYETSDGKVKQMKIFRGLIQRIGGLQDRKDELQKASKANTPEGFISNAVFDWSVSKPEFKNQGAIMLAIMMDKNVIDDNGVAHPFIDKNTGQFTALDIDKTGGVFIKEGFKENFSFDDTDSKPDNKGLLSDIAYQSQLTISATHGNYSSMDAMMVKKGLLGKAAMNFMTWLPAHTIKRWGMFNKNGNIDINPATGKLKRDGIYVESFKGSPGVTATKYGADMALAYNLIPSSLLAWSGMVGGSILTGYLAWQYLKKVQSDEKSIADHIKISGLFILDTLKYSSSFSFKMLSVIPGASKIAKGIDKAEPLNKTSKLTPNQVKAIKAVAQEMAVKVNMLIYKLMFGALLWDDDDPAGSSKKRLYHFIQNQLWKSIDAVSLYSDPTALWDTVTEISLINETKKIIKATELISGLWNGDLKEIEDGLQGVRSLMPIPSDILSIDSKNGFKMVKNPFLEDYNLSSNPFVNRTGKYTWVDDIYKNIKTDGMYGMEKEWREMREEIAIDIDRNFQDVLNKEELSTLKDATKKWIFADRPSNLPPEEFRKFIDAQDPDRKIEDFGYRAIGGELVKEIYMTELKKAGDNITKEEHEEILEKTDEKTQDVIKRLKDIID